MKVKALFTRRLLWNRSRDRWDLGVAGWEWQGIDILPFFLQISISIKTAQKNRNMVVRLCMVVLELH